MNIRFAVVAAASAFAALPGFGQGIQVTGGTNITLGGLLAVGVKQSEASQGSSVSSRVGLAKETHVDDNTSRLIISSTSKITEGWNVIFRVESRFTADVRPGDQVLAGNALTVSQASGWADGDTWGGISSPFGTITVGKSTLYYTDTISVGYLAPSLEAPGEGYRIWDANGLATFNLLSQTPIMYKSGLSNSSFTLGNTRSRNVVRYDTPLLKQGEAIYDFSLAWSKNPAGSEVWYPGATPGAVGTTTYTDSYSAGSTIYARGRFNGYGISASASYLNQKINGESYTNAGLTAMNGPMDTKAYRLGVSYKWNGLKAGLIYDHTSIENGIGLAVAATGATVGAATRGVYSVPVSFAWGDHAVYATYTKAGDVSSISDSGAKQLNLCYDYALTKRAFVGLYYTSLESGRNGHYTPFLTSYSFGGSASNPAGTNGETFKQIGVNLNYWF